MFQPFNFSCSFSIYKQVEDLKQVERKFAKSLGIPIDQAQDNKPEKKKAVLNTDESFVDPLEVLNKKKDQEIEALSIKELYRYRIMLTFHGTFLPLSFVLLDS